MSSHPKPLAASCSKLALVVLRRTGCLLEQIVSGSDAKHVANQIIYRRHHIAGRPVSHFGE
jgi:hypothetical protein